MPAIPRDFVVNVRDTSCFCRKCFNQRFQKDSCCKGWHEYSLATSTRKKSVGETSTVDKSIPNDEPEETIEDLQSTSVIPEAADYVAAIYEREPYIGQVEEIDEEDGEAHIDFIEHSRNLARLSKFKKPKKSRRSMDPARGYHLHCTRAHIN